MNDFKYEVDDGKVTITRYKGNGGDVVVPDTIDGRPVVAIGVSAFGRTKLTSIHLPNSVTTIGSYAFRECFKLTSITLPNSITTIGDWAFARCFILASVTMPDSLTDVGEGAFEDCPAVITVRKKGVSSDTPWWDMAKASNNLNRAEAELLEDLTMEANVVAEKNAIAAEIAGILNLVDVHFGGLGSVPISEEIRAEFRQKILELKKRGES